MIFIIHSLDQSTDFLSEIPHFIHGQGLDGFEYFALEHPVNDLELIIEKIKGCPAKSLVIFLGHGASHCIYLPETPTNNTRQPLINKNNFQILQSKNFISLSCRSAEFIRGNYILDYDASMIGFDDLPTHWPDVLAQREVDVNAYSGITDEVLTAYRQILVDVFKNSLKDTLVRKQNFSFFYYRLRLYINKNIANVLMNKISNNPCLLANILFELKHGIGFFGDGKALLNN